ncbi:hypothetical protein ACHAW6_013099 [Cyclotella cf. meneghiniana]
MPTMVILPTMFSSPTAPNGNNNSPIVGPMPTSKMVWLNKPFKA